MCARVPELQHLDRRRGSYGIDAPTMVPIPVALLLLNLALAAWTRSVGPLIGAGCIAICMGLGFYASMRGKFVVWAELLRDLNLRGDERILDLGCGRGAVLLMAAQCLTTGKSVGVNIWSARDQSGNSQEATLRNAVAEGVSDRIEVHTADMTQLPFPDGSFDLVVSNIAIHNLPEKHRSIALDEAVRVIRSGGRLLIADIFATADYEKHLRGLEMKDLKRRALGPRQWWGGPWVATALVTATKPE